MLHRDKDSWVRWACCGSVGFGEGGLLPGVASRVAAGFHDLGAERMDVNADTVTFKSGWTPMFSGWNVLAPFGSGVLEVDAAADEIRYRLSLLSLIVRVTVAIVVMGSFGLLMRFPGVLLAGFLAVGWLWLVGGNLLIGVPHFERFLRRSVSAAPEIPLAKSSKD